MHSGKRFFGAWHELVNRARSTALLLPLLLAQGATLPRRDSSSTALEGVDLGVEMPLRGDGSFMIDVICKGFGSILNV
jgi:hypothetical protein